MKLESRRQTSASDSIFSPLPYDGTKTAARGLSLQLKSEHLDDALDLQVVKNLFFIGKCFAAIPLEANEAAETEEDDEATSDQQSNGNPLLSYQMRSAIIAREQGIDATEPKDVSVELRDLVQSKVGATKFSGVYNQIRQGVLYVQKERKEAKILPLASCGESQSAPERGEKGWPQEKVQMFSDGKGKLKRRREA
ncbi:hypothetical protein E1B28_010522 [Marasmius oreades]|uniref:Uncharacterized protein n=1 Tax=Marasmius oreades TaxID=181124 RepID=A0A9P7RYH2_9AGAR|nr:uncharacterized protein E1B28_010522 [Marasmius oreades]KAG7091491.1 hypothetical protein E1B28_010522 [Marasmius oreades]